MFSILLKAQDPQFTQFYAAPVYLNPAFTGLTDNHRIAVNYRNQWPSVSKSFQTYLASYDYNLQKVNSGIGLTVMQDRAGTAGLTHTQVGANYAYHFKVSKMADVRMGANVNYNMKRVDFGKLKFNDQITTGSATSLDAANYLQLNFVDFAAGALLSSDEYWFGISAKHLAKPNSSLIGNKVPLPLSLSIHGGYHLNLKQKSKDGTNRYFLPAFNYRHQQKYDQLDVGVYYYHIPLNLGLWYRGLPLKKYAAAYNNSEAIALLVGFDVAKYNLHIGYSYDITISKLGLANTSGAHEISIIYELRKAKKITETIQVIYPKF